MPKAKKKEVFLTGVNLAPLEEGGDERRFEEGDEVPELTAAERKALEGVIAEKE